MNSEAVVQPRVKEPGRSKPCTAYDQLGALWAADPGLVPTCGARASWSPWREPSSTGL